MRPVVVVLDAYRDGAELIAAGAALAREHRTRLEVIEVLSPVRELLAEIGRSLAPIDLVSREDVEWELWRDLTRALVGVPRDVPLSSRIVRSTRQDALRVVAALTPVAVIATGRFAAAARRPVATGAEAPEIAFSA